MKRGATLLGRIGIPYKLALISVSFSLPIAVLLYLLVSWIDGDVRFSQLEQWGNEYQADLEVLLELIPEHGLLVQRLRGGDRELRGAVDAKQSQVRQAFGALEAIEHRLREPLQFTDEGLHKRNREHIRARTVRREWEALSGAWETLAPETFASQQRHLVDDVRTMITHVGDTSNLILDPDLDSYYTMDMTLLALPQTQDRLATIAMHGLTVLAAHSVSEEDKIQFAVEASQLKEADLDRIRADAQTALNEDPNFRGPSASFQRNLPVAFEEYVRAQESFITLVAGMAASGRVGAITPSSS
jgi:hypothetical protein